MEFGGFIRGIFGYRWVSQVSFGVFWYRRVSFGIFGYHLVYFGISGCFLVYFGIFGYHWVYSGISRYNWVSLGYPIFEYYCAKLVIIGCWVSSGIHWFWYLWVSLSIFGYL